MYFRRRSISTALLLATLSGCATLPPHNGGADVTGLLAERGQAAFSGTDIDAARTQLARLSGRVLGIDDAVRIALVNNPALTAEYAKLGFAAADVYDAGRLSNPVLSASLFVPDAGGERNQVGFGLAQSFTDLLLLRSRSHFAQAEFERVQMSVGAQVLNLAADTESAYYRLAGAWQVVTLREAVATAARASATLAQRFFDAGNINRLELALEQAAASQADLDVLQARLDVTAARSALNRLMGLAASEVRWKSSDRLPVPRAAQTPTVDLLALADRSRLDLAAARAGVTAFADQLGVTRRFRLLGQSEIAIDTERETDGSRITGPALALELPIFNQGQGRVARAEANLERAEAELRSLEIEIGNDVQLAAAALETAKARADHYRESLIPLRESIVARTQEEVNFMLEGQFQLLTVKQQEYDAWQGYLEAVRDYWLTRVELARAVGAALPDAGQGDTTGLDAKAVITLKASMQHNGVQMDGMKGMDPTGDIQGMDHSGHSAVDMEGMQMRDDSAKSGEQP